MPLAEFLLRHSWAAVAGVHPIWESFVLCCKNLSKIPVSVSDWQEQLVERNKKKKKNVQGNLHREGRYITDRKETSCSLCVAMTWHKGLQRRAEENEMFWQFHLGKDRSGFRGLQQVCFWWRRRWAAGYMLTSQMEERESTESEYLKKNEIWVSVTIT